MINKKVLTNEQVFAAIDKGEFDRSITASARKVAVVMTQDWCPQWHSMKSWLYAIEAPDSVDVYELIYNKADYHREFMRFKESKWNNDQIPYVRYYKDGELVTVSNYVSQAEFKRILGME